MKRFKIDSIKTSKFQFDMFNMKETWKMTEEMDLENYSLQMVI
jgi:hypothetical protein